MQALVNSNSVDLKVCFTRYATPNLPLSSIGEKDIAANSKKLRTLLSQASKQSWRKISPKTVRQKSFQNLQNRIKIQDFRWKCAQNIFGLGYNSQEDDGDDFKFEPPLPSKMDFVEETIRIINTKKRQKSHCISWFSIKFCSTSTSSEPEIPKYSYQVLKIQAGRAVDILESIRVKKGGIHENQQANDQVNTKSLFFKRWPIGWKTFWIFQTIFSFWFQDLDKTIN